LPVQRRTYLPNRQQEVHGLRNNDVPYQHREPLPKEEEKDKTTEEKDYHRLHRLLDYTDKKRREEKNTRAVTS
jgi:hypothetical protein